jgi:hypothetical protein
MGYRWPSWIQCLSSSIKFGHLIKPCYRAPAIWSTNHFQNQTMIGKTFVLHCADHQPFHVMAYCPQFYVQVLWTPGTTEHCSHQFLKLSPNSAIIYHHNPYTSSQTISMGFWSTSTSPLWICPTKSQEIVYSRPNHYFVFQHGHSQAAKSSIHYPHGFTVHSSTPNVRSTLHSGFLESISPISGTVSHWCRYFILNDD